MQNDTRSTHSMQSVSRYVLINFSIFLVIILVFFSYTINLTYQWGSDDTFHYFLTLQAEKHDPETSLAIHTENQDFKIYHHYQDLPQAFKSIYPKQKIVADDMLVYETEESFNYILPYVNKNSAVDNNDLIYIEHPYYFHDDEYDVAISIPQLISLIISCALLVGLLFYLRIAQKLSREIKSLANWVIHQPNTSSTNESINFPFIEIQTVATKFQSALNAVQCKTDREKNFLKSLSHELRTPLAIIKASLELIEKTTKDIPENIQRKLIKIQAANQTMSDTSDSLLQIWSDSKPSSKASSINPNDILKVSFDKYQHLLKYKTLSTNISIADEQLLVPQRFVQIIVDNLVKNAYQYSSEGEIDVLFKNNSLTIINPLSVEDSYTLECQKSDSQEYGYGVGLFVVETICERMQWRFNTQNAEGKFEATVEF